MEKECAIADCHSPASESFSGLVTKADHMDQNATVYLEDASVEISVCKSCANGIMSGTIIIPPGSLRTKEFSTISKMRL